MANVYWIYLEGMEDITKEGYVGFTTKSVETRFKQHIYSSNNQNKTYKFVQIIRKYKDKLKVKTLVTGDVEYCLYIENTLRPAENIGWNTCIGGEKPTLGYKTPEEVKLKQSIAAKGRKMSEAAKQKISIFNKGLLHTEESKLLMSEKKKGKPFSDAHKAALAASKVGSQLPPKAHDSVNFLRATQPWVFSKRKESWYKAQEMYLLFLGGKRQFEICNILGQEKHTLRNIFLKFQSGWNPFEDTYFCEWLKVTNENKT